MTHSGQVEAAEIEGSADTLFSAVVRDPHIHQAAGGQERVSQKDILL